MSRWKEYVDYDQSDQSHVGQQIYYPGPLDNSRLVAGQLLKDSGWQVEICYVRKNVYGGVVMMSVCVCVCGRI